MKKKMPPEMLKKIAGKAKHPKTCKCKDCKDCK